MKYEKVERRSAEKELERIKSGEFETWRQEYNKILGEIKSRFNSALYDYADWCHTQFEEDCYQIGESIIKLLEHDKVSYLPSHSDIGKILVKVVYDCKDIVVNIEGEKDG